MSQTDLQTILSIQYNVYKRQIDDFHNILSYFSEKYKIDPLSCEPEGEEELRRRLELSLISNSDSINQNQSTLKLPVVASDVFEINLIDLINNVGMLANIDCARKATRLFQNFALSKEQKALAITVLKFSRRNMTIVGIFLKENGLSLIGKWFEKATKDEEYGLILHILEFLRELPLSTRTADQETIVTIRSLLNAVAQMDAAKANGLIGAEDPSTQGYQRSNVWGPRVTADASLCTKRRVGHNPQRAEECIRDCVRLANELIKSLSSQIRTGTSASASSSKPLSGSGSGSGSGSTASKSKLSGSSDSASSEKKMGRLGSSTSTNADAQMTRMKDERDRNRERERERKREEDREIEIRNRRRTEKERARLDKERDRLTGIVQGSTSIDGDTTSGKKRPLSTDEASLPSSVKSASTLSSSSSATSIFPADTNTIKRSKTDKVEPSWTDALTLSSSTRLAEASREKAREAREGQHRDRDNSSSDLVGQLLSGAFLGKPSVQGQGSAAPQRKPSGAGGGASLTNSAGGWGQMEVDGDSGSRGDTDVSVDGSHGGSHKYTGSRSIAYDSLSTANSSLVDSELPAFSTFERSKAQAEKYNKKSVRWADTLSGGALQQVLIYDLDVYEMMQMGTFRLRRHAHLMPAAGEGAEASNFSEYIDTVNPDWTGEKDDLQIQNRTSFEKHDEIGSASELEMTGQPAREHSDKEYPDSAAGGVRSTGENKSNYQDLRKKEHMLERQRVRRDRENLLRLANAMSSQCMWRMPAELSPAPAQSEDVIYDDGANIYQNNVEVGTVDKAAKKEEEDEEDEEEEDDGRPEPTGDADADEIAMELFMAIPRNRPRHRNRATQDQKSFAPPPVSALFSTSSVLAEH